jgi:signal transduction histidine kinase/FixJ family two-component response regulator
MILIVDDKPENIYSLKTLLEAKKLSVDTALCGEEALKKVLINDYSLIILDVQMPGMDGFEVAETLSGFKKSQNIPIIFLSAVNTNKQFIIKGYESGGIDYLTKPVDPDILLLKVNTFTKLYQQTKELNEIQTVLREEIEIRKKVQAELKQKVEQLHATLEALPFIAFTSDLFGSIDFVNGHWFNYSENEKHFPPTHLDDVDILKEWNTKLLLGEGLELEIRIKRLDSLDYRSHLLKIVPIKNGNVINKWIGTFTDIEDQKQVERKKDEFLSIASHELKTPLTSIRAYIQLIDRGLKCTELDHNKKYVEKAQAQVTKLNDLIAQLLDVSKIENGKVKLNIQPFNIKNLIENSCDIINQIHENSEITILGNDESLEIFADEARIEQVLINYLTNAFKYSPDNKQITIERENINNELTIRVKDNGIGIPQEKQNRIFSKFYRVEESSLKFQGLGIGLYISAEIIKKHQGKFGVTSSYGNGSEFYFSIPIKLEQ